MALEKQTAVDQITAIENGNVQVRTIIRIVEDGEVLSTTYHRHVLQKGDDISGEDAKVQAVCNAVWI
jgi:hypothetical protein